MGPPSLSPWARERAATQRPRPAPLGCVQGQRFRRRRFACGSRRRGVRTDGGQASPPLVWPPSTGALDGTRVECETARRSGLMTLSGGHRLAACAPRKGHGNGHWSQSRRHPKTQCHAGLATLHGGAREGPGFPLQELACGRPTRPTHLVHAAGQGAVVQGRCCGARLLRRAIACLMGSTHARTHAGGFGSASSRAFRRGGRRCGATVCMRRSVAIAPPPIASPTFTYSTPFPHLASPCVCPRWVSRSASCCRG